MNHKSSLSLLGLLVGGIFCGPGFAASFDAAPAALPLPEGNGLLWEDPREIHQVVVNFEGAAPAPNEVQLEYWGSRWPEQRLPKDREPGGGDVGWMELGNWHQGGWRKADTKVTTLGTALSFTFNAVDQKEFPQLKNYPAVFRYTLKICLLSSQALPKIQRIQVFTDSTTEEKTARVAFQHPPQKTPVLTVYNGELKSLERNPDASFTLTVNAVKNSDPNTFDRTLVTVTNDGKSFTFAVDDLAKGELFIQSFGAAVLPADDTRDYAAVSAQHERTGAKTIYDRVAALPEQTWDSAWRNMPPKKSRIYFPLGLDGGRQRFLLAAEGNVRFRSNDQYLQSRPGRDTPQLAMEPAPVAFHFGNLGQPSERHLEDDTIPICHTTWETNGLRLTQSAVLTELGGTRPDGSVPPADTLTVLLLQFSFTNTSATPQTASLPLSYSAGDKPALLKAEENGLLWLGKNLRAQVGPAGMPRIRENTLLWEWALKPGETRKVLVKIPYLVLSKDSEREALSRLDFETERSAVAAYWKRRLDSSAKLVTPEPILNSFYRATSGHLLINCEREPQSTRRFARVGSFLYGAYGNESCMMVVDLDRRGFHREAQECLDAWLHYQGSVGLPGDFSSKDGILYGAGGYESGGYNQHHGWILWMLAEHFRFTRDVNWLRSAAPGVVAGAEWIIRETQRTSSRHELERGLLPAGSLEDIGDWWTWLSTSCYSWRGLDSAAWALGEIQHPEASRIRQAAADYRRALLANFRAASARSPVVRLRDGRAVPQIPSQVHRRGRSFGWICQTLEGAMHLLITGALDPRSAEALSILKDYEDNLYLSNQYGYLLDDFDRDWFSRGGMSMQACLLLDVEPYLDRDDVKHALRAMFNAIAVSHFPDVHMNTEHALPEMGDWRGDHYKTSDEANACGWLRQVFIRERGDELVLGQAVPGEWLKEGRSCGIEHGATHFGPMSLIYTGGESEIIARLDPPRRNPPTLIRLRFRADGDRVPKSVTINDEPASKVEGNWVILPGTIGSAVVRARY